jgi:hypothetical protein
MENKIYHRKDIERLEPVLDADSRKTPARENIERLLDALDRAE